jgi:cyclopropane-fatty-acyl-phospholipid synthase
MASVAEVVRPVVHRMLGDEPPIQIRCWDGSSLGPPSSSAIIHINSPNAFRRLLYAPNELGLGRAYVAGEIDISGDVFQALRLRDLLARQHPRAEIKLGISGWRRALRAARDIGAIGRPLPPPPQEARLRGPLHSRRRDAQAVSHHYDVSNDFYRLILGRTMTYSCAYFEAGASSLDDAQTAKHELVSRKLGLRPGMRLLDVGCGWGSMLIHAARHHDIEGVGVTVSKRQAEFAAKRVAEEGFADRIEIRLQDYRDVRDGPYDAISSIGMFEHVGIARLSGYFSNLYGLLSHEGRLLNHAISRPPGRVELSKKTFISRYVFPDGELQEVGSVVTAMQTQGFEVRDVESLREHYALTLRQWVTNLEREWDRAIDIADAPRARIWRLYMAGSVLGFEAGRINVHQVLGVKTRNRGLSGMPLTRSAYLSVGPLQQDGEQSPERS